MRGGAGRAITAFLLLPSLLVLAAELFVLERPLEPSPDGVSRPLYDGAHYTAMAEKKSAPAPFRYRVLGPALAALHPSGPVAGLHALTTASLWACAVLMLWMAARAELNAWAARAALCMVASTSLFLFPFHSPWLVDGLGLLVLHAGTAALLVETWVPFLGVLLAGVLVREGSVFLAPAWWVVHRWQAVAVAVLLAAAVVGVRMVVDGSADAALDQVRSAGAEVGAARAWHRPLGDWLAAWHVFWVLGPLGLWLSPPPRRLRLSAAFAVLLAGAAASLRFATDSTRMVGVLMPVMALGTAEVLQSLRERTPRLAWALVGWVCAGAVLWVPFVGLDGARDDVAFKVARAVYFTGAGVLTLLAVRQVRSVVPKRGSEPDDRHSLP